MIEREAHVVPHPNGGWEVIVSGREGGSVHATQREAHHAPASLLAMAEVR